MLLPSLNSTAAEPEGELPKPEPFMVNILFTASLRATPCTVSGENEVIVAVPVTPFVIKSLLTSNEASITFSVINVLFFTAV